MHSRRRLRLFFLKYYEGVSKIVISGYIKRF
jgi:hypothetical protein